jgi:drug/metabolite transporter superfamily protein YnfA
MVCVESKSVGTFPVHMKRTVHRTLVYAAFLLMLLSSATALADHGTVHFQDGGRISGDITFYRPGQHALIVLDGEDEGEIIRVEAEDILDVVFQSDVESQRSESNDERHESRLELEVLRRDRPTTTPVVGLIISGVALAVTGLIIYVALDARTGRAVAIAGGALSFLSVAIFLPLRLAQARRWDARIEELELRMEARREPGEGLVGATLGVSFRM